MPAPLRLRLDSNALVANWRTLAAMGGTAACGAAVKADGYGLGAINVAWRLARAGCRDFYVSNWAEAEALASLDLDVSVFHGVRPADLRLAASRIARPVLSSAVQIAMWKEAGAGPCDVMVDTGINRLGISCEEVAAGLLDGLKIETLMSHLACAETDNVMNARQRGLFAALGGRTSARRMSLANSAGIALGADYAFDLTRPGLALYGGIPCPALTDRIQRVVTPEAQVVQLRRVEAGESVGYNATFTAAKRIDLAILNIGYADGYWRGFSDRGVAIVDHKPCRVVGRVSMDLTAIDISDAPALVEGDWVAIDYALPEAAAASGMSQYELLTGLGHRYDRVWI